MSKQNPTIEDSEEYKELEKKFSEATTDLWLNGRSAKIFNFKLQYVNELIKQFHYGPVDSQYIKEVKDYVIKEGL